MSHLTEPLGLTSQEDRVYLALLERGRSDPARLGEHLGVDPADLARPLARLVDLGLVHRDASGTPQFRAVPPDASLHQLLADRRRQLHELATEVDRRFEARQRSTADDQLMTRLEGRQAVSDAIVDLQRSARSEVLAIEVSTVNDGSDARLTGEAGIDYRTIFHADALASQVDRAAVRGYLAAGGLARVHATAGPRLLIVDDTAAVVAESWAEPHADRQLLLRSRVVVEVLRAHFERCWEAAAPLDLTGTAVNSTDNPLTPRERELLALMAAGLKDRSIARALGVTERTVGRRVTELMRRLDASTRFGAGVLACQRGWISLD